MLGQHNPDNPDNSHDKGFILEIVILVVVVVGLMMVQMNSLGSILFRPGGEYSDLLVTFWPNIAYIKNSWVEWGQFPLWRTLIFSGSPIDPDPQAGLWYPPNLLFLFLPIARAFNVLFLLHAAAGGVGMWLWARSRGLSAAGRMISGLAFALTPRIYAHLGFGHVGLFYAAAYIPFIFLAAEKIARKKWAYAGLFGIVFGWQMIAHLQMAFYSAVFAGIIFLWVVFQADEEKNIKNIGSVVLIGSAACVLALAVSAAQWMPLVDFAPLSSRAQLRASQAVVTSLPMNYLWGLWMADRRGFMDYLLYVGLLPLALAIPGLSIRRNRLWGGVLVVALLYTLGEHAPIYNLFQKILPFQSWLRAPTRIWIPAAALLSLLAGEGWDRLNRYQPGRGLKWIRLALASVITWSLGMVLGYTFFIAKPPGNFLWAGIFTALSAGLILVVLEQAPPRRWTAVAALVIVTADLGLVNATLLEGRPLSEVFGEHQLSRYLAEHGPPEPHRVYSPGYSIPRHWSAYYGIESADGVDPLYLAEYDQFMQIASGVRRTRYGVALPALEGEGEIHTLNRGAEINPGYLGLLNVYYVAADFPIDHPELIEIGRFGDSFLYQNQAYLPRAAVVGSVQVVENFQEALTWLGNHDFTSSVVVENGIPICSKDLKSDVEWVKNAPNHLELNVELNKNGMLVLSQVWYAGWEAEVDDEHVPLVRVNGVLSGLYLNPGRHQVTLKYRPPTLLPGIAASAAGVFISVLIILTAWKRNRNLSREET